MPGKSQISIQKDEKLMNHTELRGKFVNSFVMWEVEEREERVAPDRDINRLCALKLQRCTNGGEAAVTELYLRPGRLQQWWLLERPFMYGLYVIGSFFCYACPFVHVTHRRRIDLEDKAKVVASAWGTDSLPRWLFCLGLFETNGWVQPLPLPC